jgi:hypothetical protein
MNMARIASEAKAGFYATPPEMMELICRYRLTAKKEDLINILDPCAGEGHALRMIQEHLKELETNVISYGNELELGRYQEASKHLDHVIHGGYEGLRTSPSHTLLWGNPPYDFGGLERMELTFLRLFTYRNANQKLQPGAVVCLCIPQEILADVAVVVGARLSDIAVYRFTDEYYPRFRQVVLFGYFKEPPGKVAKQQRDYLIEVSSKGPSGLLPLDHEDGIIYTIPAATSPIEFFRGEALNPEELAKDLLGSPVFQEVQDLFMPPSLKKGSIKRPPLPPKVAHIATLIAAGSVDGNMGGFYINGLTKVVKEKVDIENDAGKVVREEYFYRPKSITRVFHPEHGILDLE